MNKLSSKKVGALEAEFGEFEIGQVMGGGNPIYLRFGYWRRINVDKLKAALGPAFDVEENDIDDDDCGTLYSYRLK